MAENFNDRVRKLDESFGTYSNAGNKDIEATVTDKSEDDKQQPLADDLGLDYKQPGTNDAPQQAVPQEVTPAQRIESDQIQARDRIDQARIVLDDLQESADALKEHAKAKIEDVVQAEERDVKKAESEFAVRIEQLEADFAKDPMTVLKEIGKVILMIVGALTILKMLCGRH